MNKYKELLNAHIKAQSDFNNYLGKCVEVDLSLMRSQLPKLGVILLHVLVERYYPETILSSRLSHGGVDCMKLMATKEVVLECFELLLMHYKDTNNKYMQKVITEFSEDIRDSNKTVFSLSNMLKQRGYNQ